MNYPQNISVKILAQNADPYGILFNEQWVAIIVCHPVDSKLFLQNEC